MKCDNQQTLSPSKNQKQRVKQLQGSILNDFSVLQTEKTLTWQTFAETLNAASAKTIAGKT